jgi:8-oxo-dGTP pyrophosphatase MutT (NUDIX family)
VLVIDPQSVAISPKLADCASRSAALGEVTRALAAQGLLPGWRDELYRIATAFDAPPLALIERAAARMFGIHTWAAHANGLVAAAERPRMWLARRSATKPIDPGLLDNLVGGGIAAGASIAAALHKECWEEAGIHLDLARKAQSVGSVEIRRDHPGGLQAETVFMHDLWLPAGFVPLNQDGEAVEHRLCDLDEVFALIAEPHAVTLDASLVALDCILRLGTLDVYRDAQGELIELLAATRD